MINGNKLKEPTEVLYLFNKTKKEGKF